MIYDQYPYKRGNLDTDTNRGKAKWGHGIRQPLTVPGQKPRAYPFLPPSKGTTLATPLCWTSSLRNYEKGKFCSLRHPNCVLCCDRELIQSMHSTYNDHFGQCPCTTKFHHLCFCLNVVWDLGNWHTCFNDLLYVNLQKKTVHILWFL